MEKKLGSIDRFNIPLLRDKYNLKYYVETGTGVGECLHHALIFNFEKFFSIEIHELLYNNAMKKYAQFPFVFLINDNSKNGLLTIKNYITEPALFFLDAHFPGADFHLAEYDSEIEDCIRIPLEEEIKILKTYSHINESVIIIDDLRIYEDGPFMAGNWKDRQSLGAENCNFIFDAFKDTHNIRKDYRDQGYLELLPK